MCSSKGAWPCRFASSPSDEGGAQCASVLRVAVGEVSWQVLGRLPTCTEVMGASHVGRSVIEMADCGLCPVVRVEADAEGVWPALASARRGPPPNQLDGKFSISCARHGPCSALV
ncbi:hypothetical protein Dimus_001461 [Dionaea muscipula]